MSFFDGFHQTKKMHDVRTMILAAVSRSELCYVSENEGFRLGKKRPYFEEMCLRCSLHARSDEVATKSLRSCNEVATKLDPSRIPCASPASPHPSIKESTKGGRREAPPPLWMGVGRLVRHKESLMVQLRSNFVTTS